MVLLLFRLVGYNIWIWSNRIASAVIHGVRPVADADHYSQQDIPNHRGRRLGPRRKPALIGPQSVNALYTCDPTSIRLNDRLVDQGVSKRVA